MNCCPFHSRHRMRICSVSAIPTGLRPPAQGWRACEPTLGWRANGPNPERVPPPTSPGGESSVHWQLQRSRNLHCDHQPPWSSPSPPLEERAGGRRPSFGIWLSELFWDLGFGIWSFPRPVHGKAQLFIASRSQEQLAPPYIGCHKLGISQSPITHHSSR